MTMTNFDNVIDRRNTHCVKYDGMKNLFGRDDLTPLWIADMDFEVCPAISDALLQRFNHKIYGYHAVPDSYWQSIVRWLSRRHGLNVSREELCYVPGVVRGLAFVVNFFTKKGDKILIQQPVYHPFKHVIEGNGRIVVKNPLICTDGSIKMDLALLKRQIAEERPKMMILCNPHNPGGVVWDKDTLRQVAQICHDGNVIVVSDEIHGDLELFGNRYTPFATVSAEAEEISISLGAPSKTFNIPGLASSWCVIKNPRLREDFFNFLSVNELSEPPFPATVATEAAYNLCEDWLNEMLAYVEGNVRFVESFIGSRIPEIKVLRPQASYLVWLDCTNSGLSGCELRELLIGHAHLALNDGEMFGDGGECHVRLNAGCPRSVLEKALNQLADAFSEIRGKESSHD